MLQLAFQMLPTSALKGSFDALPVLMSYIEFYKAKCVNKTIIIKQLLKNKANLCKRSL